MVPIAVPAPVAFPAPPIAVPPPPMAPPELAAPVTASLDPALWGLNIKAAPASGRRRGAEDTDTGMLEKRGRRPSGEATASLPVRLLGKGKSGAARLLVLALVVGAEGVAVTTMTGHATAAPADPSTSGITGAYALTTPKTGTQAAASALSAASAPSTSAPSTTGVIDVGAFAAQQQESSDAKVTAALTQAKAAAARVKAAADRRARAMRDARRDPQAVAKLMLIDRGWGAARQYQCLDMLWTRESGWNYKADNPGSTAYGIAQALPGSRMASVGSDWRTNPVTQMIWGLDYIADRYGTPCGAWAHSQSTGWY